MGVTVIDAQALRRSGVASVNEALMRLAGVPGRQDLYGGGEYALDLRGFGASADSNQAIVLDGVRLNEADLGGTRLAGIPIDSVERIEVLRGSGAVLYGGGATGGVIRITTRAGAGTTQPNGAQVHAQAGSLGLRALRGSATVNAGGWSLDVAQGRRDADNHRDNFKSAQTDGSVQVQWVGEGVRLALRHAEDQLETGLPGSLSWAQYNADPSQTKSPNDRAAIQNVVQSALLAIDNGPWQVALDAGWRGKTLDSVSGGWPYQYAVQARTLAARVQRSDALSLGRNVLSVGWDGALWQRVTPGAFGSTIEQDTHALYVQDALTLPSGTRWSLGWRGESVAQLGLSSQPRLDQSLSAWELGWSQPITPAGLVYARVGESFRLANLDEQGFTTGGLLRPQQSRDLELGTRWRYAAGQAELRWYRHRLSDEIGYDATVTNPTSWSGLGANVNFDPTERSGLELETRHTLSRTLDVSAQLALRQARFTAGAHQDAWVHLVPRSTLAVRADWRVAAQHVLGLGLTQTASQYVDDANTCQIPSATTLDARWRWTLAHGELALAVNNLTDQQFFTQAYRCAGGLPSAIYPEPGRSFTASLRWAF